MADHKVIARSYRIASWDHTGTGLSFIDYVVRHEAEHSLPALLEALGASRGWNTFRELFTGAMGRL